ncbi:MAG: hypothetical protein WC489_06390 [Patescibacteria group bacterium]
MGDVSTSERESLRKYEEVNKTDTNKTTIKIEQPFAIVGWRIQPISIRIDRPPKWFHNGDLVAVYIIRKPPVLSWIYLHTHVIRMKLFKSKRSAQYLNALLNAYNRGFELTIAKYKDDPMFFIEKHFMDIGG